MQNYNKNIVVTNLIKLNCNIKIEKKKCII